ncbi:MAG: peptidylprolyl isomerase [Defluviitaleaceae bacterium]|nr:peptidylprolyl isomerase [Defluviitaleaceae bacterium]
MARNMRNREGKSNSKFIIWGAIGLAVIITAVVLIFTLGGFGDGENPVVARVEGHDITRGDVEFELNFAIEDLIWEFFMMHPDMEGINYNAPFRDGHTFAEYLRREAARMAAVSILMTAYAQQHGVSVSEQDRIEINQHINNMQMQMGPVEWALTLADNGIRDREHLQEIFYSEQLVFNLINAIIANPAAFPRFTQYADLGEVLGAKHILLFYENFETHEAAEAFAYELLARALAGEDFDMLVATYGGDPGMEWNPQGYTFVRGVMVEPFYDAVVALPIGGISGVVHNDEHGGIHIIKRIEPPDLDNIMRPQGFEQFLLEIVFIAFNEDAMEADIEFLRSLDRIPMP